MINTGCAPRKRPFFRIPPPAKEIQPLPSGRPEGPPPQEKGGLTPQRQASARLVESGRQQIVNQNYAQATKHLQDAINIDPNNGGAYYYLGVIDYYQNHPAAALGFLDKAERLLHQNRDWIERIEELRRQIQLGPLNQLVPAPPEEETEEFF